MRGRIAAITAAILLGISGGLTEAGEIVLKNGTRVPAHLMSQALLVSTGSDLVEVQPEQVVVLSADEIRTRDGRTIRGSVVGGTIRARTTYGELTVALDDLVEFRADGAAPSAPASPPSPPSAPSPSVERPRAAAAAPSLPSPSPPSASVERPQAAAAAPSLPTPSPGVEQPQAVAAPGAPAPPARESEPIRRGAWDKTMDFARSVTDGVDRIHDGFVTAGRTIRDGMFSAARAIRKTFTD